MMMSNLEKYNGVFCEVFNVDVSKLNNDFTAEAVEKWDSITQMSLINQLEDCFEIMFEIDDIIEFTSYEKGKEILAKYSVEL